MSQDKLSLLLLPCWSILTAIILRTSGSDYHLLDKDKKVCYLWGVHGGDLYDEP